MPLLIAGTGSGCGKSTVTLAILAALRRLGRTVQPFKAGPDFIDPGLHSMVAGRASRNLDLWMCGERHAGRALAANSHGADCAVIEGVMGYYDGGERSTAALAHAVGAKVVLVLDARGMAESAGAVIAGYAGYGGRVDGVIFNRVGSERHYMRLKAAAGRVEPLGFLPRDAALGIPERHLGLTVAEESPLSAASLESLSGTAMAHIEMDRVAELAKADYAPVALEPVEPPVVRIALARDTAFCFYYEDNLEMLRAAGAEIVPFSPISDARIPDGTDALYLGGGYPELHARELESNAPMREAMREWVAARRPAYAECGGLMYLGEGIRTRDGFYSMCGALPVETELLSRQSALGYRELTVGADCILGPSGARLRGHEFHYSKIVRADDAAGVKYNVLGENAEGVSSILSGGTLASYTHVHFGGTPEAARHFIEFIRRS